MFCLQIHRAPPRLFRRFCQNFAGVFLFSALLLTAPAQVLAAANAKLVQALIVAAQKDLEAGFFDKAATEYLEIYRQDPTLTVALYNAARAFHLGNFPDKAEQLYRRYLALPKLAPAQIAKVEGYLQAIQSKKAEAKAAQARTAQQQGDYRLAAELWLAAARLDPAAVTYLAHAGRAAQLAENKKLARDLYAKYLAQAPADAPERADVQGWQAETQRALAAADDASAAAYGVAKSETHSNTGAYVTLASGAAVFLGGAIVLARAKSAQTTYEANLAIRDESGGISGIRYSDATAESNRINRSYAIGFGAVGVGAVAGALGAWWVWRAPKSTVSVVPAGLGAVMTVKF